MLAKHQVIPPSATQEVAVLGDMDYKVMTVTELKAQCKSKGIEGYSTMSKVELIEALEATH